MRAIDAENIRIKPEFMHNVCGMAMIRVEDVVRILNDQPTIQPKRGKWIMSNAGDTFMTDAPKIIYCSSCNVCAPYATNYCPMCGADMRGKQDE